MTIPELEAIKERVSRATEGPWLGFAGVIRAGEGLVGVNDSKFHEHGTENGLFIAHARTDIPRLIKALEMAIHVLQVTETQPDEPVNADNCRNTLADINSILRGERD